MEQEKLFSLGSIILVKESVKKIMIIGRAVFTEISGEKKYFDYVGCTYPEGIMGEDVLYFQHEDVVKKIFEGYSDEENEKMVRQIEEFREKRNERERK